MSYANLVREIEQLKGEIDRLKAALEIFDPDNWPADASTDTAPNDDTTVKSVTLQKLSSPPSNAAYVAFSNNPGGDVFYFVLEEG